jgi:serine/threonine protein kinase
MSAAGPLPLSEITGMAPGASAAPGGGRGAPGEAVGGGDRYEKLDKLGEGCYGVVYRANDRLLQRVVALKKVRMNAWSDGVSAIALREICALKELRGGAIDSW